MRMVRSSGEQPRDVKRRYTIRGGSIPPRAEQQEQSIFCNKHTSPSLETVQPTRKEDTGQTNSHWRLGKTSKKINNHRLKRFGQRTFFLAAGKTANKNTFHKRPSRRGKTAALMASMEGIARVQHPPPIRQGFFLSFRSYISTFSPFQIRLTRSTLPTRPVRIRGLPQFYFQKGEPHARLLKNFPGV